MTKKQTPPKTWTSKNKWHITMFEPCTWCFICSYFRAISEVVSETEQKGGCACWSERSHCNLFCLFDSLIYLCWCCLCILSIHHPFFILEINEFMFLHQSICITHDSMDSYSIYFFYTRVQLFQVKIKSCELKRVIILLL